MEGGVKVIGEVTRAHLLSALRGNHPRHKRERGAPCAKEKRDALRARAIKHKGAIHDATGA
jgi:hypothetical protein